jgi:hypothetical protein
MVFIELVKPCSFEWTVHSSTDVNFLPYQWRRAPEGEGLCSFSVPSSSSTLPHSCLQALAKDSFLRAWAGGHDRMCALDRGGAQARRPWRKPSPPLRSAGFSCFFLDACFQFMDHIFTYILLQDERQIQGTR